MCIRDRYYNVHLIILIHRVKFCYKLHSCFGVISITHLLHYVLIYLLIMLVFEVFVYKHYNICDKHYSDKSHYFAKTSSMIEILTYYTVIVFNNIIDLCSDKCPNKRTVTNITLLLLYTRMLFMTTVWNFKYFCTKIHRYLLTPECITLCRDK